jgi:hypothetical protein
LPETLPTAVRAFLREFVETYEELEVLLLLHRRGGEAWTPLRLAEQTGHPGEAIAEALDLLALAGCVAERRSPGDPVVYRPRDAAQAAAIGELALAYERNPVPIIKLMSANAIERVRNAAIHRFADAFVIGRKKDG